MFQKRGSTSNSDIAVAKRSHQSATAKPIQERPRVCLIDVPDEIAQNLIHEGFDCYCGTLGSCVEVGNHAQHDRKQCLLHFDFPLNLHEYDIVVIDLQQKETIAYSAEEHTCRQRTGHEQTVFQSAYPETIFDPRPFSAHFLGMELQPFMEKESILLVFAGSWYTTEYFPITITPHGENLCAPMTRSIYDFYRDLSRVQHTQGKDTKLVLKPDSELGKLLAKHNDTARYDIAFEHPKIWENGDWAKDQAFVPLMEAGPDKIVAFTRPMGKSGAFFFPRIERKQEFLLDLLQKVLPGIVPGVFPFSTQHAWLPRPEYRLPNEEGLLKGKADLKGEYDAKLKEIEDQIAANRRRFGFLHDLLTQSGAELVKTVEEYLKWLGFEDVVNVDETEPDLLEEDLRIEEDDPGLLVIEVKGIGGTSTDADCSQVNKFRLRRMKERKTTNVFALYLVNHQRFLPPEDRKNPPFSEHQIADAKNDDRGLLTTYDLFKLYFNIESGQVSKADARAAFYQKGLVEFRPSAAKPLPCPSEIHHNGYVVIFSIDDFDVTVGDSVLLDNNGRFTPAEILDIRIDDTSVPSAKTGEIGVKLTKPVRKGTVLWLVDGDKDCTKQGAANE